jgi:diaminopimelate epimerase
MRFTKMHGIGNDYVYVNCFEEPMPTDPAALAVKIAVRHFGVGGDGLILICPSKVGDARMRMFNADGSESEMCGNGVRCVAKYVFDHGIARKPVLNIETGNGVLPIALEIENDKVKRARVDMGEPILDAAKIPTTLPGERVVNYPLSEFEEVSFKHLGIPELDAQFLADTKLQFSREAYGLDPRMTCVSMGNPHVTLYCNDVSKIPLEVMGPQLENASIFPRRINVHFVQVHSPTEVTMRTWERGSGITLACGTGASAVCVAGVLTGRGERKIVAHLPGGDLELEWSAADNHVYMTGPATEVFSGEWNCRS